MNTQLMIAGYCPVGNYSFEIIYKKYHTFFVHYAEKTMGEELYADPFQSPTAAEVLRSG